MEINWDKIKSVKGSGINIPSKINNLFTDSKEFSNTASMRLEFEIINAGLLSEAAYYTIDLLIEAMVKNNSYSKLYGYFVLLQLCLSSSDEIITINNDKNEIEELTLTIACRSKIKSYLEKIKNIEDNVEPLSHEYQKDIIEMIELWDDDYSNDKYFEE